MPQCHQLSNLKGGTKSTFESVNEQYQVFCVMFLWEDLLIGVKAVISQVF